MKDVTIGNFTIGTNHPPLIVAEVSANHNHSLEKALQIVEAAHQAGVHAIKLQTYTPDTMTIDYDGPAFIQPEKSLWKGQKLYDLYKVAYTPWDWHEPIFDKCKELGLLYFSSPFDESSVDFLQTLDVPCYKIASQEIGSHHIIKKAASTKKPLIISCGAASLAEIDEAVSVARLAGCPNIILLKCTTAYPANPTTFNLRTISHLSQSFDTLVGLSDHSLGIGVAIASISHGACLIEKHITLCRNDGGIDSAFSLEPHEFSDLVKESCRAWQAQGTVKYGPSDDEMLEFAMKRSLYFVQDLQPGEVITKDHIKAIRPAGGLAPKWEEEIIGCIAAQKITFGMPVQWNSLLQKKK